MDSYMVLEQTAELEEWEKNMISESRIDEVLFANLVRENENGSLWYDITGKQDLALLLEDTELDYKLLCRFFMGLCQAAEKISSYLLCPDELLLNPECIFYENKNQKFYFCYYPGTGSSLAERLLKLTESLLPKINHQDEQAVELAYGLYEEVRGAEFNLGRIQSMIRMEFEIDKSGEDENIHPFHESLSGEKAYWGKDGGEDKENLYGMREKSNESMGKSKEKSILHILKSVLEQNGIIESFKKRTAGFGLKDKFQKEQSYYVFEPEEECEKEQSHPTILLSQRNHIPEGILRYEGNGACEDLRIRGESFLIGSGESCDGRIPSQTVSRKHAKITKKDDIYFIEDLNSSNGTEVGGELLNYKTKSSLQKNEVIMFADEKFRFI